MFGKRFVCIAAGFGFVLASAAAAAAQTAPVRGVVLLRQADGTETPVVNALVEPYRSDIDRGGAPSARTNRRGEFNFVGFQLGARFFLAVSGEGISPNIYRDVRAGMEDLKIIVGPGDGRKFTEEEARAAAKAAASASTTPANTEEAKKQDAEYQKKLEAYNAEKKKAEDVNKIVNSALKDGDAAFKERNYDVAIAKFDEGINADPDFEGSAPVLLNYKGVALRMRGFEAYQRSNRDAAAKNEEMAKARADFLASAQAFERGLAVLAGKTSTEANIQAKMESDKRNILTNFVETHRLMVRTKADTSKAKEAISIYEQYFQVETDPARKLTAMVNLGDILREAGESEDAIKAYRAVLEVAPDNPDSMAGLGLSLFNVGVIEENKEKMQEGLDIMQKFADTAPDSHPLKVSVKEAVEYLKTEQKLTPQKRPAPARRRG